MSRHAREGALGAVGFPLALDASGRTETVRLDTHVEQLVEQLLLTDPGERVNRPTLGCGLIELVFDGLSDELVAATEFTVQSRLQEWLGDLIAVQGVTCRAASGTLLVTVSYTMLDSGRRRILVVQR